MQTPAARHRMLHRMGLRPALPTVAEMRDWAAIDDRIPPKGKSDGEFHSFAEWVNKASSWIGFTGAKCYDAKDRPCRNGGDFARARDENAFPVRWYYPDRFGASRPLMEPAQLHVLKQLLDADSDDVPIGSIIAKNGGKPVRLSALRVLASMGMLTFDEVSATLTDKGRQELRFDLHRAHLINCVRRP